MTHIRLLDAARAMREVASLDCNRPWSISTDCERKLTQIAGFIPHGGWRNLVSLLAGLVEQTENDRLVFSPDLDNWNEQQLWQDAKALFSDKLMPPNAAAHLFIMLGIHPLWGLRLAQQKQDREATHEAMEIMPKQHLIRLASIVDETIELLEHELLCETPFDEIVDWLARWVRDKHEEIAVMDVERGQTLPLAFYSTPPTIHIVSSNLKGIIAAVYEPLGFSCAEGVRRWTGS